LRDDTLQLSQGCFERQPSVRSNDCLPRRWRSGVRAMGSGRRRGCGGSRHRMNAARTRQSGKKTSNFNGNRQLRSIDRFRRGERRARTHFWILLESRLCGCRPHPDRRQGCPAMRRASA
jgi:hypothetical protein